jgi:hypothetical protein
MNNLENILQKLTNGIQDIMFDSYPLCQNDDPVISSTASKINNTAFELKRITVLLQNELNQIKK